MDLLTTHFTGIKVWKQIDTLLGHRNPRAEYTYADVIQTWVINIIGGSRRLEHCTYNRSNMLANPHFKKGMSPDTVSRVLRMLACENTYYTKIISNKKELKKFNHKVVKNPTAVQKLELNEVNDNSTLNALTIDMAIFLGLLKAGAKYELDIDATVIPTKVSDSRNHYLGDGTGYCPMVVMLGGIPIFMECRNGNSSPSFRKKQVLENAIDMIESRGIGIKFVRIDAAGHSKVVIDYLFLKNIPFYIRASARFKYITGPEAWESIPGSTLQLSEGSVNDRLGTLRKIDYRRNKDRAWSIITNDPEIKKEGVIEVYNQRGCIEQRFADLKEMGWHYMVHRELKYNAVHLSITMLAYTMFLYAKKWFSIRIPAVKESLKPKTFIKKFIQVITVWSGLKVKFLNRQKEFAPLEGFT